MTRLATGALVLLTLTGCLPEIEGPELRSFTFVAETFHQGRETRAPIDVVIDAIDNRGGHGQYVDSDSGERAEYPFEGEDKRTPYMHTVIYEAGLTISASFRVRAYGVRGDRVECWVKVLDREMPDTRATASVSHDLGDAEAICLYTAR